MPAGESPSPILKIEAATISQEPVEVVEDLEAEVKRKCGSCLDALREALPLRGEEEGGETSNDAVRSGDATDNDLIGRTIEKCAMMLVRIIHDCPLAHKSWPIESEVRRPCCCDIVSRTRREIEHELHVRYGDRDILPRVDDRSSLESEELVVETDDASPFEEGAVACPTFVGSRVESSLPPGGGGGGDLGPLPSVSEKTALSTTVRYDGVMRAPEPRSPAQTNGEMTEAATEKALECSEGGEGDAVVDRGRVERATVSVKMEEVATEQVEARAEGRGAGKYEGAAAAAAAISSSGASGGVGRRKVAVESDRTNRCISSDADKVSEASSSYERGRRGAPVDASLPEAEPGRSAREIFKSESGAALAVASGTGNGRASQSEGKVIVEATAHVRNGRPSEGRPRHRGNRQDLEKQREQASEPRCQREGCPEPAVHGPEGERPLWCHLDYVVQETGRPLRCSVLKSNFKACWRETGWAWPGKPPTHCNMHRHSGMVDVVELLRERFDEIVWPKLLALGWRTEKAGRIRHYWLPPNVVRGTTKFRSRVDYFDRKPQVIRHCLQTEKLYGVLLEDLLEQTPGAFNGATAKSENKEDVESSCSGGVSIDVRKNASLNGKISESSAAETSAARTVAASGSTPIVTIQRSEHERQQQQQTQRRRQEKAPPSKSGPTPQTAFTHHLFSLKPPAAKKKHCRIRAAETSAKEAGGASKPERKEASKGESGSGREARRENTRVREGDKRRREYKWQRAARLRDSGQDARIVTGVGIAQSFKRVKGFLKRMEPREDIGDPLAALVASLGGGFDALRPRAEEKSARGSLPSLGDGDDAADETGRSHTPKGEAQLHDDGETSGTGRRDLENIPGDAAGAGAGACSVFPDRDLPSRISLRGQGDESEPASAPAPAPARPVPAVTKPCIDDFASLQQQQRSARDCTLERETRTEQVDDNRVQSGGNSKTVALSEEVDGTHGPERLLREVGNGGGRAKVETENNDQNGGKEDARKDQKGKRKAVCLAER